MEIKLIYSTLDIPVNSVICCLYFKDYPYVTFGVGSGRKLENASLKSIQEALLIRNSLIILKKMNTIKKYKKSKIHTFLDHAVYASYHPSIANWIRDLKEENIDPVNKRITLEYLKRELSKRNINSYFVDITKRVFQKIGFYQSKTIIPSLCQKDMDDTYRFLNNERLFSVPKDLGYRTKKNIDPHPFG